MKTIMFILATSFLMSTSSRASEGSITCEIPRMEKNVVIEKAKMVWVDPDIQGAKREVASLDGQAVRTKFSHSGMEKFMMVDGKKFTIHIENLKQMNEVDDYILIRSKEGHEMTYPISCQNS